MGEPFDDISSEQLSAFVAGELGPEDERRVLAWAASHPMHQARLREMRELWELAGNAQPEWDAEAVLQRIKAHLTHAAVTPARRTNAPERRRRSAWLLPALKAAAVAAVLVGGIWTVRIISPPAETVGSDRIFTSERGERVAVSLPDGSSVMLAPESRLRVSATYPRGVREVELEGVASFEVAHDESSPFVVRAGDIVIRDLGTWFVVRARDERPDAEVFVAEGSVVLRVADPEASDSLILAPADLGRAGADGRLTLHRGVSGDRYVGWTEGRLIYERTPLADVVDELSRWYDVDIALADPALGERRLSATFHDISIAQVMEMIQAALVLEVSRDGRRFLLSAGTGGDR